MKDGMGESSASGIALARVLDISRIVASEMEPSSIFRGSGNVKTPKAYVPESSFTFCVVINVDSHVPQEGI